MNIYIYLDESGSIHKNSRTKYFAVGGYFAYQQDKVKITSKYKKLNYILKRNKQIELTKEIKSFDMTDTEKIRILTSMQEFATFRGCAKVFQKEVMKKEIVASNLFFNYAVKLLIQDCILPYTLSYEMPIHFIISCDNRNIRVGDLKNLEDYLKTEFCLEPIDFHLTYYDSRTNYGIQLADLIVNTFYNYYKDQKIVANVIPYLEKRLYYVSTFPSSKIKNSFVEVA